MQQEYGTGFLQDGFYAAQHATNMLGDVSTQLAQLSNKTAKQ